ncbi:MAG: hypothetical protein ACREJO_08155 [Phycisphaerales bacterium]
MFTSSKFLANTAFGALEPLRIVQLPVMGSPCDTVVWSTTITHAMPVGGGGGGAGQPALSIEQIASGTSDRREIW